MLGEEYPKIKEKYDFKTPPTPIQNPHGRPMPIPKTCGGWEGSARDQGNERGGGGLDWLRGEK